MKRHIVLLVLVLLAVIPQLRLLFSPGFYPMHDDTQVARVVAMGKALRNGQFPVRWVQDLGYGYGYPIYNFYAPLPYYVGGVLYAVGINGLYATKLMFIIGVLAAAIAMYIMTVPVLGRLGAWVTAVAYSYMPYHAIQLYIRGSIGEYWSTIFIPFIVLGILLLVKERHYAARFFLGLGICGVVLSHTLMGFATITMLILVVVFVSVATLLRKIEKKYLTTLIMGIILGLGLSAFFWLPAFVEMKETAVSSQIGATADFRDHFVCVSQLWYSPWGFGGSQAGCIDGLSFSLGKIFVVLGGVSIFFALVTKTIKTFPFLVGLIVCLVSLFFMLPVSRPVWEILPQFSYLQYPWRFLTLFIVGLSVLIGSLFVSITNNILRLCISLVMIVAIVVINIDKFQPKYLYNQEPLVFESVEELRYRASKVSDEYLPQTFVRPQSIEEIGLTPIKESETYALKIVIDKETYKKFEFESTATQDIILQHAHFPGWIYIVNGQVQPLRLTMGRPIITIPKDFSTAEMKLTDTMPRKIGNLISLIFVVLLVYTYGKKTIS